MKLMKEMKTRWIGSAVLSIILGLLLVLFPGVTLDVLCYVLGGLLVVYGVYGVITSFAGDPDGSVFYRRDIFMGALSLAAGLFLILKAELVMVLIPYVIGMAVGVSGLMEFQRAFGYKKLGLRDWWLLLIMALLTLGLAVLLFINPFASLMATVIMIGCAMMYEGVMNLVIVLYIGKRVAKLKERLKENNR